MFSTQPYVPTAAEFHTVPDDDRVDQAGQRRDELELARVIILIKITCLASPTVINSYAGDPSHSTAKCHAACEKNVRLFRTIQTVYPHVTIGKVWIYRLLCVCVCVCLFVCLFVRLRISRPRIKLAASNFARRFIDVQGRE